jgi:predicted nicotinamide N-methyase
MADSRTSPIVSDARAFVAARAPLRAVPTLPEIRLHLADASSGLSRLASEGADFRTPYWAYVWAGGAVLARYILDHPGTVAGRRVLDFGAGSGLVAIVAMRAGALAARAVDVDRFSVAATALNAEANGVVVEAVEADLTAADPPDAEIILAGDVFYEPALAGQAAAFFERCVEAGIKVLIGDPRRRDLPVGRLRLITEFPAPDFGGGMTMSGVYAFERVVRAG